MMKHPGKFQNWFNVIVRAELQLRHFEAFSFTIWTVIQSLNTGSYLQKRVGGNIYSKHLEKEIHTEICTHLY